VDWYNHIVLTLCFKLVSFFYIMYIFAVLLSKVEEWARQYTSGRVQNVKRLFHTNHVIFKFMLKSSNYGYYFNKIYKFAQHCVTGGYCYCDCRYYKTTSITTYLLCKPSYNQFSAKFLKFRGRIWLTSFNSSALKTFARRKYLGDVSHTSRVIANFGSKSVVIATRVGRGRIWLTSLNSPTQKTPC